MFYHEELLYSLSLNLKSHLGSAFHLPFIFHHQLTLLCAILTSSYKKGFSFVLSATATAQTVTSSCITKMQVKGHILVCPSCCVLLTVAHSWAATPFYRADQQPAGMATGTSYKGLQFLPFPIFIAATVLVLVDRSSSSSGVSSFTAIPSNPASMPWLTRTGSYSAISVDRKHYVYDP